MSGSKAKQYPAQTGSYAVKVKNGASWNGHKAARLHISIGQEYHEGEKLKATFNWVSQRFDKVIVCVNDVLQRFNYEFEGMAPADAYKASEEAGTQWIDRNLAAIRAAVPNAVVCRWEDWTEHPRFLGELEQVKSRYDNDFDFKQGIDAEVISFWSRRDRSGDFERFKQLSTEYLLEETAAFFIMFGEETAVNIYPGSTLIPCDFHSNSGGFTRIDFKKNQPILQVA